jgi:hypothetical protein
MKLWKRSASVSLKQKGTIKCRSDRFTACLNSADQTSAREYARVSTNLNAVMYYGTRHRPISIRDVSRGGLGLANAGSALPGDRVDIRLLTGEVYRGRVRWWCNGFCGMAFLSAIEEADPIFALARRRRRLG